MKNFIFLIFLFSFSFGNTIKVSSYNHNSNYEKLTYKIAKEKVNELSKLLILDDVDINVLLFNNHKDFYRITGLPEHIPGALITTKNTIYLKTPVVTKMDKNQYQKLIYHEMIHAIQNQRVSLSIFPDWFNEGFAEYFSGSYDFDQKIRLSKILLSKQSFDLNKLINITHKYSLPSADKYILSSSIIEFLYLNFGDSFFNLLFEEMEKTKNFNQAIYNTTNLTIEQIDFYWHQYLENKYDKLFLLDLQYIIWLFLPFLFIFSFIVKQILNQTIINRWKYEKLEEQINKIFNNQFFAIKQSGQWTGFIPGK